MRAGLFRDDLYYRINVIGIHVPALRDRKEDIPLLARFLLGQLAEANNLDMPQLTADATTRLMDYDFPGNIRELENILARAMTLSDQPSIDAVDIAFEYMPQDTIDASAGDDDESVMADAGGLPTASTAPLLSY